jgi:hypothetical protein
MVSSMPHGSGDPTGGERSRRRSRTSLVLALGLFVGSLALVECQNDDRSLGQGCVKDEDCTSGYCSGQVCVAAPPTFDGEAPASDAEGDGGGSDAPPADAKRPSDAPRDAKDAAADGADSGGDAPPDADMHDTTMPGDGAKGAG